MTSGRTVLYVAGGGLLVAWLAAANMPSQDTDRTREPERPVPPPPAAAIAEEVHSQAARLQARMAAAPVPERNPRNPFAFGATPRARATAADVRPVTVDPVPDVVVPPPPALTLMGIAEEYVIGGYRRTAVIGGDGDEIFMVAEGDRVGERYKVTRIGADAVELEDLVTKAYRRIGLR